MYRWSYLSNVKIESENYTPKGNSQLRSGFLTQHGERGSLDGRILGFLSRYD